MFNQTLPPRLCRVVTTYLKKNTAKLLLIACNKFIHIQSVHLIILLFKVILDCNRLSCQMPATASVMSFTLSEDEQLQQIEATPSAMPAAACPTTSTCGCGAITYALEGEPVVSFETGGVQFIASAKFADSKGGYKHVRSPSNP